MVRWADAGGHVVRADRLPNKPCEGIHPNSFARIADTITRLNSKAGLTVILVEQNVAFARRAAHRVAMMEKARVVAAGATQALIDDLVHRHMAV